MVCRNISLWSKKWRISSKSLRNFGSIPPLIQLLRKKLMGLVHPQVADAPEIATHPVLRWRKHGTIRPKSVALAPCLLQFSGSIPIIYITTENLNVINKNNNILHTYIYIILEVSIIDLIYLGVALLVYHRSTHGLSQDSNLNVKNNGKPKNHWIKAKKEKTGEKKASKHCEAYLFKKKTEICSFPPRDPKTMDCWINMIPNHSPSSFLPRSRLRQTRNSTSRRCLGSCQHGAAWIEWFLKSDYNGGNFAQYK